MKKLLVSFYARPEDINVLHPMLSAIGEGVQITEIEAANVHKSPEGCELVRYFSLGDKRVEYVFACPEGQGIDGLKITHKDGNVKFEGVDKVGEYVWMWNRYWKDGFWTTAREHLKELMEYHNEFELIEQSLK